MEVERLAHPTDIGRVDVGLVEVLDDLRETAIREKEDVELEQEPALRCALLDLEPLALRVELSLKLRLRVNGHDVDIDGLVKSLAPPAHCESE